MLVGRNTRVAESAGENRIEITRKHFQRPCRQRYAFAQKLLGAPIKVGELQLNAARLAQTLKYANSLAHDFGTNAVIPGDGIGPEVVREAVRVLERLRETR